VWEEAQDYSAKIGGLLYRNVKNPIIVNGKSLITLSRNTDTGILATSMEILDESGYLVCRVVNNDIDSHGEDLIILRGKNRVSAIDKKSGQVFLDLSYGIQGEEYEIELSALCAPDRCPIILHPERTKCGNFNDGAAPNLSRLSLATNKGSQASGIDLRNSKLYLLDICIENFLNGISITVGNENADN